MEKRKEVRRNLQAANKLNQVKKINIFFIISLKKSFLKECEKKLFMLKSCACPYYIKVFFIEFIDDEFEMKLFLFFLKKGCIWMYVYVDN